MSVEQGPNPLDNINFNELFKSINSEYKRGGKFGLDKVQQIQVENFTSQTGNLSSTYIARFFVDKLPRKPFQATVKRGEDIRDFADYINTEFKNWQVNAHKHTDKREDEKVVRRITLDDLAFFAKDRFEEFAKQSGRAVPDSADHKSLQERVDYWAWVGQVMDEAIEQNKKKP